MRSIAILNQKGGVGKTTTSVNLAAGLTRTGRRVLLVDLDPQSHATMHVGVDPADDQPGVYDVLVEGRPVGQALRELNEGLALLPASLDLVGAELELAGRIDRELILKTALASLGERFDYLIIDCPPSLGTLTVNALCAVRETIIPLQPHFLALQGLGRLLETVTLVRGVLNPELRISGIVLCMYESATRLAQEVANDVRCFLAAATPEDAWYGARVFETVIRRNVKLAECPSFGQTIFEYAPGCHGAADYQALTDEVLAMAGEREAAAEAPAAVGESVVAQGQRPADEVTLSDGPHPLAPLPEKLAPPTPGGDVGAPGAAGAGQ